MAKRKDGTRRGTPPLRIIPNKNRRLQVAPTRRRLFDAAAQAEFLEWFAATCNCALSARKVGFHYRTVIRHWREDPGFGARCEAALARPIRGDRPPPPEHFAMDPSTALQLLREHKRHLAGLPGGSGRGAKPGRPPTLWSFEDSFEALEKELKLFGIRIEEEDAAEAA